MRYFLCIAAIFLTSKSNAAGVTVVSVEGASNYTLTPSPIILGGLAGLTTTGGTGAAGACNAALNNTSTCNSCPDACATAPLCPCNPTRIYSSLKVRINVTKPDSSAGNIIGTWSGGTASPVTYTSTGPGFIDVLWQEICNHVTNANSDCDLASGTASLNLYIDKNGNNIVDTTDGDPSPISIKLVKPGSSDAVASTSGITGFEPYPGDEKIYIRDPEKDGGFPILPYGGTATKVRVYTSDINMADAVPGGGFEPQDLNVSSATSAELNTNIVDGLTNGTPYAVRVAVVDDANNIALFFPDAGSGNCDTQIPPDPIGCDYAATPDAVLGLLTEDMNCFIATAAYGSSLEPKLNIFREFRYKVLLRSSWGQTLVKKYYKYGAKASVYIYDKPAIRAIVRVLLWPVYAFSYIAVKVGFAFAVACAFVALSLALAVPFLAVRRMFERV